MNALLLTLATTLLCALMLMLAITWINARAWPRWGGPDRCIGRGDGGGSLDRVAVLVPARDEAAVLAETLERLCAQEAPGLEILVLDDASRDETADLVRAAARRDPRLRLLSGRPLPPGWLGKNWACQQLSEATQAERLVFTDADVEWEPGAVAEVVALQDRLDADLLSIWPTQRCLTLAERLVVPLMTMAVIALLPLPAVRRSRRPSLAAANGQCLVFRRSAYEAVGGHASVRDRIVEDVELARAIKTKGLRLDMAEGKGRVRCRMYRSWSEVRDGFAKNLLAGHGDRVGLLLLSVLVQLALFVLPWVWAGAILLAMLGLGGLERLVPEPGGLLWPCGLIAAGLLLKVWSAGMSGQRRRDALLLPLSILTLVVVAGRSIAWRLGGGPRWKGRRARVDPAEARS